jgi:hypothetical protein
MFHLALPLACAVAYRAAVHTATIGGRVPHTATAPDGARLQPDRLGQTGTDPIDRLPPRIQRGTWSPSPDAFFSRFHLLRQAGQDRQGTAHRSGRIGGGHKSIDRSLAQAFDPLGTQTSARMPPHQVLHAEDLGRLLGDERPTLA